MEGPVATAEPRIRPVVVTVPHDERREPFVEILAPVRAPSAWSPPSSS